MLAHRLPWEFLCHFLIAGFSHKDFRHLAIVTINPPELVPLATDLHESLAETPLPAVVSDKFEPTQFARMCVNLCGTK